MRRALDPRTQEEGGGPTVGLARSPAQGKSPERDRRPETTRPRAVPPIPRSGRSPELETLWEPRADRVERAGRGVARWGRHRLAADSVEALRAVGIYGAVEAGDLNGVFESGRRARRAVAELERAGLLRTERFRRGRLSLEVATLTQSGKRLMERSVDPREPGDGDAQAYHAGPARSAQVLHDIAVYRAGRKEAGAIRASGGRVLRVRTDEELQRIAKRIADRAKRDGAPAAEARAQAAAELDLAVVVGKLAFPDARIEYETSPSAGSGGRGSIDVEVTTSHYRDSALRAKSDAGFQLYAMDADGQVHPETPSLEAAPAR